MDLWTRIIQQNALNRAAKAAVSEYAKLMPQQPYEWIILEKLI
jgi:hypothetical protein